MKSLTRVFVCLIAFQLAFMPMIQAQTTSGSITPSQFNSNSNTNSKNTSNQTDTGNINVDTNSGSDFNLNMGLNLKKILDSQRPKENSDNDNMETSKDNKDPENQSAYDLSNIQKSFSINLEQFGYKVFNTPNKSLTVSSASPNYRLQRGDKLKIFFWGDAVELMNLTGNSLLEPVVSAIVDGGGNLFVPGAGVLIAEGNSISGVESELQALLSSKYSNFKVKVTLEDPRNYNILVVGNVEKPGTVSLNSSYGIIDALALAGGISRIGSLRNVSYIDSRTKKKTSIDLYDIIIKGSNKVVTLKDGDVIVANPIGKTIALARGVKNPAIYEFKNNETLKEIVTMAGGLLSSINPNHMEVEGFDAARNQKTLKDMDFAKLGSTSPQDGDILSFVQIYAIAENTISLEGNIKTPARFQYRDGIRLSDIIKSKDDLLPNTYTAQIVIYRTIGLDKTISTVNVNMEDFFNGLTDPELQKLDIVKVLPFSKMNSVEALGDISNPGLIPLKPEMSIKDLLSIVNLNKNPNDLVLEVTNQRIASRINVIYLYELLTQNVESLNIKLLPGDKIMFRSVTNKENLNTVNVSGEVNFPGQFNIKPGMRLKDLLNMSGGLTGLANLNGIVFLRKSVNDAQQLALKKTIMDLQENLTLKLPALAASNKQAQGNVSDISTFMESQSSLLTIMLEKAKLNYGRIVLNIPSNDFTTISEIENLEIRNGDEIYIPQISNHILVVGEVYNQSAIVYNPGKKAKFYLDMVGGPTKEAFKRSIYIVRANGKAESPGKYDSAILNPGDSIIVPKKIKIPGILASTIKDFMNMGFQLSSTIFMLTKL